MSGPPAFAERLLAALLGRSPSTPFVVGDLREEYLAVRTSRGSAAALAWYVVQALLVTVRLRWERIGVRRRPVPAARPSRSDPGDRMPNPGDFFKTELRQAVRFLRRRPTFSASVVLTVALVIAATTVAFAVVNGVLLEPLPYRSPERLVAVWERNPRSGEPNVVSPANFLTWRDELRSLDAVAAIVQGGVTLLGEGEPERVGMVLASAAYFEAVGAEALVGRLYAEEEDADGADPVVVVSEGFWRRRFGADPALVGRTLQLGGLPHTVVGVLPRRFDFDVQWSFSGVGSRDVWLPLRYGPEAREAGGRFLQVIARLSPGTSTESAQEEASALAERLEEALPERQRGWGVTVVPLREDLVGDVRPTILVVFGAVCFVLLIACANVANLLITRAAQRQQEMAVRSAMGAGRGRMVRQLLVESALLSGAGGVGGLVLASWGVEALVRVAPDVPRLEEVGLDATVTAFALLATLGTALVFGLAPVLHVVRSDVASWLRDRSPATGRGGRRVRSTLMVTQVALSLVLLVGAGLLVRSLANRLEVGAGFDVERLVTAEVQVPGSRYDSREARARFFEELVEGVKALPGVDVASAITWPPLARGGGSRTSFWPLDRPVPEPGQLPGADVRWVHRDYHRTMGVPVLAGRTFGEEDHAESPLVVVVNETGARRIWPGESALGKRIAMPWGDTLVAEVVGVVGDVRDDGPDTEPYPMFYWEHRQFAPFPQMTLVARTEGVEAEAIVPGIRAALRELDPELPLYNVSPMEELYAGVLARARFTTTSLGLFSLLALVLAAIGIYGVIAHATGQRTQEIGVRIALGADRSAVVRMVMRQGLIDVVFALLLGTGAALGLSRLLGSLLFGVSATDPATFVATACVLAVTALAASWLPAHRASRVDPVRAMRAE